MSHWASKERAWREVAGSGGLPTTLAYPVLALCTGLAGEFWTERSSFLFTFVILLALFSIARELVGRRLQQAPDEQVWVWHQRYAATVLLQGLVWTTFGSITIYLNGRTWTGLMALLVTAGIVAGSTASLTPSLPLMRAYILLVCLPTSAAFVLHGSRPELMVGTTVATYCYFMLAVGRRNSLREQRLRIALDDLEVARHESDHHREQLRRLSAGQLAQIEKERLFLSREIHDDLGQVLTALKLTFARLEKQVQDDALLDKFLPMKELLDTAMVSVRNIAGSLRPPLLDELGLAPAIDRFVHENCRRANLTCQLRLPSSLPSLSKDVSLAAFRVCQEGLTNCMRHAQASTVDVELRLNAGDTLIVAVSDDGVGVPPGKPEGALGLLGLRERVRLLGGSLEISPREPRGTRLEARFPLAQVGPERDS